MNAPEASWSVVFILTVWKTGLLSKGACFAKGLMFVCICDESKVFEGAKCCMAKSAMP